MRDFIRTIDKTPGLNGSDLDLKRLDLYLISDLLELRSSAVQAGDIVLCLHRSYHPDNEESKWLRDLFIGKVLTVDDDIGLEIDDLCEPVKAMYFTDESIVIGKLSESQFRRAKDLGFKADHDTLLNILGDESGELAGLRILLQDITV